MLGSRQPRSRSIASGPRCAARRMALLLLSGLSLASIMPAITMAQDLGADRPSPRDPYGDHIAEASRRFGVPIAWIRAVMRAESAGDPRALSPKGAMGLMQIMPETWRDLRARYGLGADPFDPHDNILAGAAYLRELHDRYGSPGFLAAYNAGPGRYERHLATGRPLPDETRAYVAKLQSAVAGVQAQRPVDAVRAAAFSHVNLFVPRGSQRMAGGHPSVIGKRLDRSSAGARRVNLSPLLPRPNSLFARHADENLWR